MSYRDTTTRRIRLGIKLGAGLVLLLVAVLARAGFPVGDEESPGEGTLGYEGTLLVQLAVTDLDHAIDFYTTVLGFKLESRVEGLRWARIKPGIPGVTIGLGERESVGGTGTASLNFAVADLDRARRLLEARGVVFTAETVEVPGVVRLADFEDPDGNRIRLAQDIPGVR